MSRNQQKISARLRAKLRVARVARLATFSVGLDPHIVPICFAYDGRVLYTAIDQKSKRVAPEKLARVQNIQAMPQVALLIDDYEEDWSRLWYVLIRGKAKLIPKSECKERTRAIRSLRTKYPQYTPRMLPGDALIIRITPELVTSWGKL